ncbi:MAG: hypothetical protein K0R62_5040 [Nonomuraea muscovyensis]|nr:hypothetical protein [Nonomuraea muscovyensis]
MPGMRTPEDFHWLRRHEPLDDIYCVSFVRGLSPREVLRRFGVDESTLEEVTFDELSVRSAENAEDAAGFVGAVRIGEWTMLVEPGGWQLAVVAELGARVSAGTEAVSVCRHDYAADSFTYLAGGELVTHFDPMAPNARSGGDPDRLVAWMREVGLDPDSDDAAQDDADLTLRIPACFALASRITGLPFTPDLLELRFLGAEPLDQ